MTKAEKEKRKLDDAKKAYEEFIHGIQLIRRDIMINSTEEGELCQVIFNWSRNLIEIFKHLILYIFYIAKHIFELIVCLQAQYYT